MFLKCMQDGTAHSRTAASVQEQKSSDVADQCNFRIFALTILYPFCIEELRKNYSWLSYMKKLYCVEESVEGK